MKIPPISSSSAQYTTDYLISSLSVPGGGLILDGNGMSRNGIYWYTLGWVTAYSDSDIVRECDWDWDMEKDSTIIVGILPHFRPFFREPNLT
jgi:hypothetical protein